VRNSIKQRSCLLYALAVLMICRRLHG